jgi:hypothetical protein
MCRELDLLLYFGGRMDWHFLNGMKQKEIFQASGPPTLSVAPKSADASSLFRLRAETNPVLLLSECKTADNEQKPNIPKRKYVTMASRPSFQAIKVFQLISHAQYVDVLLNQIRGAYFNLVRSEDSMLITKKITVVSYVTSLCSL